MEQLIKDLRIFFNSKDIQEDDILYVSLNEFYWMPWNEFIKLKKPPHVWEDICNGSFDMWESLDLNFRVVLKDFVWIDYFNCWGDPYYSQFRLHESRERPIQQYFEPREPHERKLGDFI